MSHSRDLNRRTHPDRKNGDEDAKGRAVDEHRYWGEDEQGETVLLEPVHRCALPNGAKQESWGHAVDHCFEGRDGVMWAGNGEYETQVNFCPFCGRKAATQIKNGGAR